SHDTQSPAIYTLSLTTLFRSRDIGFVPQDPMSNLNPVWSIGFQVKEAIRANGLAQGRAEIRRRAIEVLEQAGLADAEKRLHQFRSEEHTSELQSRENLVCRLL